MKKTNSTMKKTNSTMKKSIVLCAMMLTAVVSLAKAVIKQEQSQACLSYAEREQARPKVKQIKTLVVTTNPQMHCDGCEKKIKGNLRFEKGVKTIDCNIEGQRVTITYDADKTKAETLINAFEKFGYKATEVKESKQQEKETTEEK